MCAELKNNGIFMFDEMCVVPTANKQQPEGLGLDTLSVGGAYSITYKPEYLLCKMCGKDCFPSPESKKQHCAAYRSTAEVEKRRVETIKKEYEDIKNGKSLSI